MDLLDLTFAELFYGITWNISLDTYPLFIQMREEIIRQLVKLVDFMEYSRYFQDLSKPRYPSHTNSRDKESLNSSTQAKPSHAKGAAKLEEQLEEQHRQGAAVQPYPVIT